MLDKSIYVHLDDAETTTISFVGGYFNPTKGFIVMSIDSELKVIISNVNQAMDILLRRMPHMIYCSPKNL